MDEPSTTPTAAQTTSISAPVTTTPPHSQTIALAAPMPTPAPSNSRRLVVINILVLLVVVLIGLGVFYFWHQNYYFYQTDDATIAGNIASIASTSTGTVGAVTASVGSVVKAGDPVMTLITPSGATITVASPIHGTIINLSAIPGEVLPAGQPVGSVVDLGALSVTAYVEETHINDVHIGQGVDITVDAYSGTTLHGRVTRILPATASSFSLIPTTDYASGNFTKVTQRVPVEMTLDGYQGYALYPGESAAVTIHVHN